MKIGFVIGGISDGGLERRTVNLVNEFSSSIIHEVFLITGLKKSNEYHVLPSVRREEILELNIVKDVFIVKQFAECNTVDLLVGMGIYANLVVCMARCISRIKTVVVEANDPKHDHLSKKTKVLRKLFYCKSDGYVFQTEEEKQFYSKSIQERSVVIHNPVKKELPFREKPTKKEIVAIGRLMPQKNFGLLIDAFQQVHAIYPEYSLNIYGRGREENKLLKRIYELNLEDSIAIKGFSLNVHEKIINSDIFVLSSDFEGMPNALLEAMSMGFPVVSTACGGGGPQEVIDNGINGLIVPVGSAEELANKIIWMIEHSTQKEAMGKEARKIRESHSLGIIVNQWEKYFNCIIGE